MTDNPIYDHIMSIAETDKVEAGDLMVRSLMAGDEATLKKGYDFYPALNLTSKILKLDDSDVTRVKERFF